MESIDFSQPPRLSSPLDHGQTLLLRPHIPEDLEPILQRSQDPTTQAWTTIPRLYTREMAEEYLSNLIEQKESSYSWALDINNSYAGTIDARFTGVGGQALAELAARKADHERVGSRISGPAANLGFVVHPDFRGRGLMKTAVRLVVDELFSHTPIERLLWQAGAGNTASWKSVEASGFPPYLEVPMLLVERGVHFDGWTSVLTRQAWEESRSSGGS